MIAPEQVAGALERIDPRDRELLALSLRRRVPDDAVALVYDIQPPEVARRRATAIERLAEELGVQRGADLGAVLKALLEEETWSGAAAELGSEFGEPEARSAPAESEPKPEPEAEARAEPRPEAEAAAPDPEPAAPEPEPAAPEPQPRPRAKPTPAPPRRPETVWAAGEQPRRRVPHLALALLGLGLAALGAALGLIAIKGLGGDGQAAGGGADSGDGTRIFRPAREGPAAAPFPSDPDDASCYPRAHASGRTTLYGKPGGEVLKRVPGRTEWGTPRVFGVIAREGDWLAVHAPELDNQTIAWMRAEAGRMDCVRWSLHADLSKRTLYVRRDGHTERSFAIGIGRRGNPTPEGRFSVTDKLRVTDVDSPYGCCVIALTGHQTRLPASWPGGDRLAVHATTDLTSIGRPATLGCMRVRTGEARWLIDTIPVGAPIFVSS
jgi:outer membrane biosynthesis protein TonB